ncbi:MAG: pyridoxamine 5'-phosphate oxidase family protein [Acidimicrobiales bacterium]
MSESFYKAGHRALQDRFDTRRLADRIEEMTAAEVGQREAAFIERAPFFWLATADEDGWPDVSYKGGVAGFVKVLDPATVAFPSYDGNGMFRSLGNISVNPRVGLLFIDFERPKRLRIKGTASLSEDGALLERWPGAQLVATVAVDTVFSNCPRYVHRMAVVEPSIYAPAPGHTPPEPEWKQLPEFQAVLPERRG